MSHVQLVAGHRGLTRRPWFSAVRRIGRELAADAFDGQFMVGTHAYEPWHLTAHLHDAARWAGASAKPPILVRRHVPLGAPAHLAVGIDELARRHPRCNVLVVAPDVPDAELLERLSDVRRRGGRVFAIAGADQDANADLLQVAHDHAPVVSQDFEVAQHLLPASFKDAAARPPRRFFGIGSIAPSS